MHRFPFRSFFLFSLLLAGSSYAGTSPERIVADVNAAGDIVGEIRNPDGTRRAVLVRQGKLIELGALGGGESFATAINQDGAVIGGARLGITRGTPSSTGSRTACATWVRWAAAAARPLR